MKSGRQIVPDIMCGSRFIAILSVIKFVNVARKPESKSSDKFEPIRECLEL